MVMMESASHEKVGLLASWWVRLTAMPNMIACKVSEIAKNTKKLGQDDPRRVFHSLKVGFALTLVSLFYYYQPLYDNFGVSAMWAVMTVVVVFEFSVGATLGKGLNRALATLLAGALGIGAHHLASLSGQIGEPIVIGFFVFLQAATSTFIRFFPQIKARYDYGLLIFILTFSLISVSGFRDDEILELAHKRLATIFIGGSACVIISIVVCPVWAGEDLHNLIAANIENLGSFLEGFGDEYFKTLEDAESKDDKHFCKLIKVLSILKAVKNPWWANFARWEPGHGRFHFCHPWKQYLKVATLTRQCAYRIEALHSRLTADNKVSPEILNIIQESCTKLSLETGKALKELAAAFKEMTKSPSPETHMAKAKAAAKSLRSLLKSGLWEDTELLEVMPAATVGSLLLDVVNCSEKIIELLMNLPFLQILRLLKPQCHKKNHSWENLPPKKKIPTGMLLLQLQRHPQFYQKMGKKLVVNKWKCKYYMLQ
ncbi:Aluminium activated malate transporter family protein [Prunus dulcis]|uniref:Aluminium activated malate transporter family protein n=1 Tax=Prunus dulcis TaxID=3755 RepID=A0A4Y1RMN4_PRUDU|nr:Aluminium activated malate transporter family protein [Prunus dulcis]